MEIMYNPYTVETTIKVNNKALNLKKSGLSYLFEKRLQEWIEPKGAWHGFFNVIRESFGENTLSIDYIGTADDFEDLEYGKDRYGKCFDRITLKHLNANLASKISPSQKMVELKRLFDKLQSGPVAEFKTKEIKENFTAALDSDFRIVVVAPMSSGKSTLINAILSRDLLPAVNQATTAVITMIRDDDCCKDFVVTAYDKNNKIVVNRKTATAKLIEDLNYMIDPDDKEGKTPAISRIDIEGNIPNIDSNILNTVFMDTPGGNNAQNLVHGELMNEAIDDEDKCLILYVFNGTQLGTNDSNEILRKISRSMRNSNNGKLSRDRFLFVANKMDGFDLDKEPYEEVIENTILPQLASNGIYEPNLFLTSAVTSKLSRMFLSGNELTEHEEDELYNKLRLFNRSNRNLNKYCSLDERRKNELIEEGENLIGVAKTRKFGNEDLMCKAADINSGIPALETAIRVYLEKYALSIKIKNMHESFMATVREKNMMDNLQRRCADSKEELENAVKQIQLINEQLSNDTKLKELRVAVDNIKVDFKAVDTTKLAMEKDVRILIDSLGKKVLLKDVYNVLDGAKSRYINLAMEADNKLEEAFANQGVKACRELFDNYAEYIKNLDDKGFLQVSSFDYQKTKAFKNISLDFKNTIENYTKKEEVREGNKKVKKSGWFSSFSRAFGAFFGNDDWGYELVPNYVKKDFVDAQQLVRDQITPIQTEILKSIDNNKRNINGNLLELKKITKKKLGDIENLIVEENNRLQSTLENKKLLEETVKKHQKDAEWTERFIEEVDDLLSIEVK